MISPEAVSSFLASFTLIGLAEIGDKSQIVCMTLALRYRHWPVLVGAATAFLLLNTIGVIFGTAVAAWLPERFTAMAVALLFGVFGIHALLVQPPDELDEVSGISGRSVFLTTLSLIFLAEFGDKTQIAVAGLASNMALLPVWLGATLALVVVSALGIWVGRNLLQGPNKNWLHRLGGSIFLVFAAIAGWQALT